MNSTPPASSESTRSLPSLAEVHRTILVPAGAGFWRKLLVFSGPGFVVAVGYMDPGNWATDIAGGSRFAYRLISILMLSNLMALLLQTLAARLKSRFRPAIWRKSSAPPSPSTCFSGFPSPGACA